ncbi:MAG: alpha/beta hydrolase [Chloroflexota bacterium]|nr:alpha/beta fold hydrolase [Chloroflexota bacterium]MDE3103070.1 alpha/beta hydrolase [Chloroflexota bacterium]
MRPFAEARDILVARARTPRTPFRWADPAVVESVLDRLGTLDAEAWCAAWSDIAAEHEKAERWDLAYEHYRIARYPTIRCAAQREAYRRSQECYLRLPHDPPIDRVRLPFRGGGTVVGDLRLPRGAERPPVVVLWGGIDSYKEERHTDAYLRAGFATFAMDMPGTGDAPIAGSEDAERLWDDVLDGLAARADVDGQRVVLVGNSTGGYWAAKLAHTHRERLVAAVDHGGPAHYAFAREWIERAERGEYPFALAETLARAFGGASENEWVERAPRLSLLDLGILDRPCAPLLLVNGTEDSVFPIRDMYLLLEHGGPKSARFYPGGHMGPHAADGAIVAWVRSRFAPASPRRGT